MPNIKNIIIFTSVALVLVLIYIFFVRSDPNDSASLVSSGNSEAQGTVVENNLDKSITQDFLTLLLNIKSIKLDDSILKDEAFLSLDDSNHITLIPDGTEGRVNPFAQFGNDAVIITPPTCVSPKVLDATTNTCVNSPTL